MNMSLELKPHYIYCSSSLRFLLRAEETAAQRGAGSRARKKSVLHARAIAAKVATRGPRAARVKQKRRAPGAFLCRLAPHAVAAQALAGISIGARRTPSLALHLSLIHI